MCLLASNTILLVIDDEHKKDTTRRVEEEVANAGDTPQGIQIPPHEEVV